MARVLCAMSGGVDSSVTAALLLEAGHEVTGVTLKLWGGSSDQGCCSVSDVDDARRVADHLGIEHHVFNFGHEFTRHVVEPYVADHRVGRTPNPCIECNRHLKFDRLIRRARALGFDAVATGHHARVGVDRGGRLRVRRGADRAKDQSYVLHMIDVDVLGQTLFPVGAMSKAEVRERAHELGLRTAEKPDSQEVCFITASAGRERFLGERTELHPADVVDGEGTVVGRTEAVELVTLGQRRGLGLAGGGTPRYVTAVDVPARRVHVGPRVQTRTDRVEVPDLRWTGDGPLLARVHAQCSAHGTPRPATVEGSSIVFDDPAPRVAPGQSVVLYDGDLVVAGGTAAA